MQKTTLFNILLVYNGSWANMIKYSLWLVLVLVTSFQNVFSQSISDTIIADDSEYINTLFEIPLEELVNLNFTSGSLFAITDKLTPTDVITITHDNIELSGARDLDHLLEIFVPSFFYMTKGNTGNSLGIRGIISDRNNKILLLVNGKIMNNRTLQGATSERLMTLLQDIERVEVIQSPQSSLYGSGAISGIIHIITKTASQETANSEFGVQYGLVDSYQNIQVRHARDLSKEASIALYYGLDYADGASVSSAPTRLSFNGTDGAGDTIVADSDISFITDLYNASGIIRHKAHVQFDYNDWSTWVRFTRGGNDIAPPQQNIAKSTSNKGAENILHYTQLTAFSEYTKTFGEWSIEGRLSFDGTETKVDRDISDPTKFREQELYSRVLLKYQTEKFDGAIGPAFSYEMFGLPHIGDSQSEMVINGNLHGSIENPAQSDSVAQYADSWSTIQTSILSEAQYRFDPQLKVLAGVRMDKHSYTSYLLSPRVSLVATPTDNSLVRVLYSRSNRRADDGDLRIEYLKNDGAQTDNIETIDYYELSGSYSPIKRVLLLPALYYGDLHVVAWDWQSNKSDPLGDLTYWGMEFKAQYTSKKVYAYVSESYVHPIDFTLNGGPESRSNNNVSSMPYGYGDNLHNVPDNIIKFYIQWSLTKSLAVSSALQVTGYLYGARDAAAHNTEVLGGKTNTVKTDGSTKAFEPSYYMQLGLTYLITKNIKLQGYGYNLLGLIDENWNKRVSFQRNSQYRIQPVSAAARLSWQF